MTFTFTSTVILSLQVGWMGYLLGRLSIKREIKKEN